MAIDFTNPRHLTKAINSAVVQEPFLLKTFFKTVENAGAETVDVEFITASDKRAQFVRPEQEAREVGKSSNSVQTVKIPTTFEKKTFTAYEMQKFMPAVGDYLSLQDVADLVNANIKREVELLKQRVITRREDLAAQALFSGAVTISQANIGFTLDYRYVANQNILTRTSTAKWDGAAADILGDFRKAKMLAAKKGYSIDTVVMHPDLADIVIKDTKVMAALHNNNFAVGRIDQTKYADLSGATYLGTLLGVDIIMYSREYVDENGTAQSMVPTTKALFGSTRNENKLFYAPITRIGSSGLEIVSSGELYLDSVIAENKRSMKWECEQKSLPAILDPNAFVVITAE